MNPIVQLIAAWAGSLGFALLFNVRGKKLAYASLGGLLAFWAVCSSGSFAGCASCSGSLWYDGWLDFLEEHPPSPWQRVYLSLGRTEEKARNPRMAQVGEATRRSFERLQRAEVPSRLVWQDGGHFHQIPRRLAGALTSLLKEARC